MVQLNENKINMRTKLLAILFLCFPLCLWAGNVGDNGYDDIDGFFGYCSKIKSPGLRYTYISSQMMRRVSTIPMGEFDLKPISDKIDFVQSVYAVTDSDPAKDCALKAEALPVTAKEIGFECVISFNKDGSHTNIFLKKGEGGFNSLLMTNASYNEKGELELAIVALIGGIFTDEEILSLMNLKL